MSISWRATAVKTVTSANHKGLRQETLIPCGCVAAVPALQCGFSEDIPESVCVLPPGDQYRHHRYYLSDGFSDPEHAKPGH